MVSAVEAHTRASSSTMMAWVTMSAPAPPYSSGIPRAGSSISTQASKDFQGNSAFRSTSAACGATFSSQKVRRVSRKSRWTSVRAKVGVLTRSFSQTPPNGRSSDPAVRWPPDGGSAARRARRAPSRGSSGTRPSSTSKLYGPRTHSAVASAALPDRSFVPGGPDVERGHMTGCRSRRGVPSMARYQLSAAVRAPGSVSAATYMPASSSSRPVSAKSVASPRPCRPHRGAAARAPPACGRVGGRPVGRLGGIAAEQRVPEGERVRGRDHGERAHPVGVAGGHDPGQHAAPVVAHQVEGVHLHGVGQRHARHRARCSVA